MQRRTIVMLGMTALLAAGGFTGCAVVRDFENPGQPELEAGAPTVEEQQRLDHAETQKAAGNYEEALQLFQEILAENPTITTAYVGVGDIYLLQEDYENAEPAYRQAAELEPRNYRAQYGHGIALQMLERFVEAVRAYHRALTIDPDSEEANLNLATTYLQMDEPDRAVVFAEKARDLNPANGSTRANLGAVYEKVGRYGEAVEEYIAALELMGNSPPLMINLVNSLAKERRYAEAMNTAETLVRIEPSARAYERLGWCHFKLRNYDRSIEAYRNAVAIDESYWPALNGIGVNALNTWILSKKRNDEARLEAQEAFRRSLRANAGQNKVVALMSNYSL